MDGKFAHVNDAERPRQPFRGLKTLASARSRPRHSRARGCSMIPVVKAKLLEGKKGLIVRIANDWGKLDFVVHSIAFSPKEALQGRVVDVSREGFLTTMEVSCWTFIRMAHLAEPLMRKGGTLFTMTYYGSQMVVKNYNIMGVAKAALESAVAIAQPRQYRGRWRRYRLPSERRGASDYRRNALHRWWLPHHRLEGSRSQRSWKMAALSRAPILTWNG